jgi:hypothetical protein
MKVCEAEQRFDARFIQLAREAQMLNTDRARIKQDIDHTIG